MLASAASFPLVDDIDYLTALALCEASFFLVVLARGDAGLSLRKLLLLLMAMVGFLASAGELGAQIALLPSGIDQTDILKVICWLAMGPALAYLVRQTNAAWSIRLTLAAGLALQSCSMLLDLGDGSPFQMPGFDQQTLILWTEVSQLAFVSIYCAGVGMLIVSGASWFGSPGLAGELRFLWKAFRKEVLKQRRAGDLAYLRQQGVLEVLRPGLTSEIAPDYGDLRFLYQQVREQRPTVILEFGIGYSSMVIAFALHQNYQEELRLKGQHARRGKLYSVDNSEEWIANTRRKIPSYLDPYLDIRYSAVDLVLLEGKPCHMYRDLPNILPQLVYIDAPDPGTVSGTLRGLTYQTEEGVPRAAMAADLLLYERSLALGTRVIVDGRQENTEFLRRHLERRWRLRKHRIAARQFFTLIG